MKKLMLLAAMLAMVLVTAAPAIAQVGQEGEQEGESGDVDQSFTATGSGGNSSSCVNLSGGGQSGNSQDQTDLFQGFESAADDFEFDESGSNLDLSSSSTTECTQEVNQSAAAGEAPKKEAPKAAPKAAPAPAPKAEAAKAGPAPAPKAEAAKAEAAKAEQKKELPKTGGESASLFALGAGALLVGGGLLARRLFR